MANTDEASAPQSAGPWPILDVPERRVLGVLIEKAKTTPDAYPLSLNALTTGCNQKSNREPILQLSEGQVEDTLERCRKKGLAVKITGGRVERWKHNLYDAWQVDKVELAVLAELLLRGPQTEGELRGRASRMEPIDDLDILRNVLRPLVERKLIVYLTPAERRGAILSHRFHDPRELDRFLSDITTEAMDDAVSASSGIKAPQSASSSNDERLVEMQSELTAAREDIAALKQTVAALQEELRQLKQSLGAI